MMRRLITFALLFCAVASAGDWEPDPAVQYTFAAPVENLAAPTAVENGWVESLKSSLQKGGASPKVVYRFVRSAGTLSINGVSRADEVYVSREDPDVYFILKDNYAHFIINFETKDISANNYGGSIFVPPSRSFCVLVLDRNDWPPGGIPITSARGNIATFAGRSVSWR